MAPPIVTATVQAAIIAAISNLLAQAIAAYQTNSPLKIDPIPLFQFTLFALISTPPNFLWQEFLETTFPAYHDHHHHHRHQDDGGRTKSTSKHDGDVDAAAAPPRRLNKRNTLAKTLLDQTAGAALNTLAFSLFMHGIRQGMAHHYGHRDHDRGGPSSSYLSFLSPPSGTVRYAAVDWPAALARARAEFWPLLRAGWRFWPLVSLANYVFLTSVEARSLLGSLAGLAWGVYVSLYAGK